MSTRRHRRIAAWPEGAVAVALTPRTAPLARFIAARIPDVDVSLPGTCMLVRRTERALYYWTLWLSVAVCDLWAGDPALAAALDDPSGAANALNNAALHCIPA